MTVRLGGVSGLETAAAMQDALGAPRATPTAERS